jgi:hypothetical protein
MQHNGLNTGILQAYLDGQMDSRTTSAAEEDNLNRHIESCAECQTELKILSGHAASVRAALDHLPQLPHKWNADSTAGVWAAFQRQRERSMEGEHINRNVWRMWSLAGAGVALVALIFVAFTLAPVRTWAENLLSIFRVQHFTVLELNPSAMKGGGLQGDQFLNESVSRILSDQVTVTENPRKPELVADTATASKLAGFPVQLLTGQTPSALLFRSGASAQMKLDRDRLQSILDEAGRSDLQIPGSVDGATIAIRVPAGIMALYGNCGDAAARMQGQAPNGQGQPGDATCVSLIELPSPTVSAPQQIDPGEIAQVALQFIGMSANDAANFTQTVDWTTTLVVPVIQGQSSYEQVHVNGNDGVLLRPKVPQSSTRFSLVWVDNGIVYALEGTGDDTTALNLASQLE